MIEFQDSVVTRFAKINDERFRCDVDFDERSVYIEKSEAGDSNNCGYLTLTPNQAYAIGQELIRNAIQLGHSEATQFFSENHVSPEPVDGKHGGTKRDLKTVESGHFVLLLGIVVKDPFDGHRAIVFEKAGGGLQWMYLPDYIECEDLGVIDDGKQ